MVREDTGAPQRVEKPKDNGAGPRIKTTTGTPEIATMKVRPRSAIIEKENLNQQFQEEASRFSTKIRYFTTILILL